MLLPKPSPSYVEIAEKIQTQGKYRKALRAWLAGDYTDATYQTVLRLLDDLGVRQAEEIRQEELRRLAGREG